MKKIFIATSSFGTVDRKPIKFLESHSYKVILNNKGRRLSSLEIIEDLVDCVGVIAGTEKYDLNVLYKLNKLKVISRLGVGIDNIDINEKEGTVELTHTLTSAWCPYADEIIHAIHKACEVDNVNSVNIITTFDPPFSIDKVPEETRLMLGW